jgi:hypothetical protein
MKKFLALGFGLLLIYNLMAQGCSDAGVCSIGGLKGDGKQDQYISLNYQGSMGEMEVKYAVPQLEALFRIGKRSGLQFKLPYIFIHGDLATTNGLGDLTAVFTHRYYDKNKWKLGLNAGVKIGVNNADKRNTSFRYLTTSYSLPMPYQTSLGTHDLLIGLDATHNKKWIFGLGFQMPVYQFNNNGYDTSVFQPGERNLKAYFTSAHLFRRPDLVLRIDRQFRFFKEKMTFQAGLLPIYHLGHDRFTDRSGVSHAISGSKGLTLNLTFSLSYQLNKRFSIILRHARPVIVRKVRPDGLTRHYVNGLELRYSF